MAVLNVLVDRRPSSWTAPAERAGRAVALAGDGGAAALPQRAHAAYAGSARPRPAPTLIRRRSAAPTPGRRSAAEGAGRVVDGVVRREHLVQADDAEHAGDIGVHAGQGQHGPGRPGPVVGADQDAD